MHQSWIDEKRIIIKNNNNKIIIIKINTTKGYKGRKLL